ncbi:MAG: hypothetical protein IPP55_11775 [Anaerolineales bacterium]|jgi:hypothetical protein|nr:hypothetical protein [Anaerolineales bacterium]
MNPKIKFLPILMTILLSACGGAPEQTITEEEIMMTYSVGTMVSSFFETQTAMVSPTPAVSDTPLPTNTFLPTPTLMNTPLPLATWTPVVIYYSSTPNIALIPSVTGTPPTATPNTGASGVGCNNLAVVRDVNYPSGTTVKAGEVITKTWKVQNTGSCDWAYNYALATVSDEHFFSSWGKLGKNVPPGNWAELSVVLEVPNHDGTFNASWRLADAGGAAFGATLSVSIVVVE